MKLTKDELEEIKKEVSLKGLINARTVGKLLEHIDALEAEHETLRMKLAGCGVAALCNTEASIKEHRITKDNPYWSASYEDVCDAVDREIKLRENLYILTQELEVKSKRSQYVWSEMGLFTLHDAKNEGSIECATEALAKIRSEK
jgi:hypothetical protein